MLRNTLPRLSIPALAVLLLLLFSGGPAQALCSSINTGQSAPVSLCWNTIHPVIDAHDIEALAWSGERDEFLAVGNGGVILAGNPDGSEWTPRDSGTVERLFGAVWDGSRYLVVGDGGLLMTSPDGQEWTPQFTNTRLRLLDIASSGSTYVAVGEQGVVLSSTDGENWALSSVITPSRRPALYSVIHHGGHFIAVGSSATIITSPDGLDWTERQYIQLQPDAPSPVILRGIAANPGGQLVAVGNQGTVFTSNSLDDEWVRTEIDGFSDARLFDVVADSSPLGFIAVGESISTNEPLVITSTNGVQWSAGTTEPLGDLAPALLRTIAISNARRITAGNRLLLTTAAAAGELDWTQVNAPPAFDPDLHDALHVSLGGSDRHLAVGAEGALLTSDDGFDWETVESGVSGTDLHGIAWNRSSTSPVLVAVGADGTIIRSTDGTTWGNFSPADTADLLAVAFDNGRFIAVGAQGTILSSMDGESWIPATSGTDANLRGVTGGGNDTFIVVGAGGTILTSEDAGANWASRDSGTSRSLNGIARGDDDFVAVGDTADGPAAVVLVSVNGQSWIPATQVEPGTPSLHAVAWNGSQYMAAGANGSLVRSSNGDIWTSPGQPVSGQLIPQHNGLTTAGNRFVAVGSGGSIVNSGGIDVAVDIDTDVSVSEDDDPAFARAGDDKVYRFIASNIGNLDALDVEFTYTPPPAVNVVQTDPADGWTCSAVDDNGAVSCSTARLAAATGESPTLQITVSIPDDPDATITNRGELTAPSDTNTANNLILVDTAISARITPSLPSPDTDFDSRGAFGALQAWQLVLLALLALYFLPHRTISRR